MERRLMDSGVSGMLENVEDLALKDYVATCFASRQLCLNGGKKCRIEECGVLTPGCDE